MGFLEQGDDENKARALRDLTPRIVPSCEHLYLLNGDPSLEHLTEEMDCLWHNCAAMAGWQAKPDIAVGLLESAFTAEEVSKLNKHRNVDRPTLFTSSMYFPFLVCEAKVRDTSPYS